MRKTSLNNFRKSQQNILKEVESKKGLNITPQKTWENLIRQVNNEFCAGYKDRYSVPKVDFFMEDSNCSEDYFYGKYLYRYDYDDKFLWTDHVSIYAGSS